jgi:hypothetical protein
MSQRIKLQSDIGESGVITSTDILIRLMYSKILPKNISIYRSNIRTGEGIFFIIENSQSNEDILDFNIPEFIWEIIFLNGGADIINIDDNEFSELSKQLISNQVDVFQLASRVLFKTGYEYTFIKHTILTLIYFAKFKNKSPISMVAQESEQFKFNCKQFYTKFDIADFCPPWHMLADWSRNGIFMELLPFFYKYKKYFVHEFLNEEMFNIMIKKYITFTRQYYITNFGINLDIFRD